MQRNLYLIIILFSLTSCYTYQVKKQADTAPDNKQELKKMQLLPIIPLQIKMYSKHLFPLIFRKNLQPVKILKLTLMEKNIK